MSFLFYKQTQIKLKKSKGKEKDSFLAHQYDIKISQTLRERASAFTSKGSITPEAALAVSFFFFGALCMVFLFEIMLLEMRIKGALQAVGKEVAVEMCIKPMIPTSKMEQKIAELLGQEYLEKGFILGGSEGFDCSNSKKYWNSTIMDLSVAYTIEVPVLMFRLPLISREEVVRIKGWTGHEGKMAGGVENEMVYVTEHGIVYHKDANCTYLDLSVKTVSRELVEELRNQSGEKYRVCQSCRKGWELQQKVYITDYGNRYHESLECSGLKRNIYVIALADIHGLGGCSKCVE